MYGKNPYANKTKEELDKIFKERTKRNKNKSKDILEQEKQNRSNAAKKCWKNEEYKQHVRAGLQQSMTIELKLKKSKQITGKNNPMYGKNSWDYMSEDAKIKRYQKICNNNKGKNNPAYGRKWMYDPKTNKRKYVKADEVEYYLSIGYVIGQNFKANKNKKRMYLPGTNMYGKMIQENDFFDFQNSNELTMTGGAAIILATFFLEHQNFVSAFLFNNFCDNFGAINKWCANLITDH